MKIPKTREHGQIALLFASIALVAELSVIPSVRTLPEIASFWMLWVLLAVSILFAFAAILLGACEFRAVHSKTALVGFWLGMSVLGIFFAYALIQWLIYL